LKKKKERGFTLNILLTILSHFIFLIHSTQQDKDLSMFVLIHSFIY